MKELLEKIERARAKILADMAAEPEFLVISNEDHYTDELALVDAIKDEIIAEQNNLVKKMKIEWERTLPMDNDFKKGANLGIANCIKILEGRA